MLVRFMVYFTRLAGFHQGIIAQQLFVFRGMKKMLQVQNFLLAAVASVPGVNYGSQKNIFNFFLRNQALSIKRHKPKCDAVNAYILYSSLQLLVSRLNGIHKDHILLLISWPPHFFLRINLVYFSVAFHCILRSNLKILTCQ